MNSKVIWNFIVDNEGIITILTIKIRKYRFTINIKKIKNAPRMVKIKRAKLTFLLNGILGFIFLFN